MKYLIYLLIFIFIILFFFSRVFRLIVFHPFLTLKYAFVDIFLYFKHKKYNNFPSGKFNAYDSSSGIVFGSGKTLSCVHQVLEDYKKYNNKKVWSEKKNKFVIQELHILSNISFSNIPYEKLVNLGQIVSICEKYKYSDDDIKHCILVIIDECQNQLHSRSFKDNISPMMLKQLTECRHFNMSIYYDSPRFNQVDALLRQCTSLNIKCRKLWRFQLQTVYDAQQVENNSNDVSTLKPLTRTAFFIKNELFKSYDSFEVVNNLLKAKDRNDLLTDKEILELQVSPGVSVNNEFTLTKKQIKTLKK